MAIEFNILDDLEDAEIFLDDFHKKKVKKALHQSLNKSVKVLRSEASKAVRKHYNLRKKDVDKTYFRIKVARSSDPIIKMFSELRVRAKPVSLFLFLSGASRKPSKRRWLNIQIEKGNKQKRRDLFVQRGRDNDSAGPFHVFRRRGSKRLPIVRQEAPSIHLLFEDNKFRAPINHKVGKHLQGEFVRRLGVLLKG